MYSLSLSVYLDVSLFSFLNVVHYQVCMKNIAALSMPNYAFSLRKKSQYTQWSYLQVNMWDCNHDVAAHH